MRFQTTETTCTFTSRAGKNVSPNDEVGAEDQKLEECLQVQHVVFDSTLRFHTHSLSESLQTDEICENLQEQHQINIERYVS